MSTLKTTRIENSIGDGVDVAGLSKIDDAAKNVAVAWVSYDSTTVPATILDSFNISAVDILDEGIHKVTFLSPMANTNYTMAAGTYDRAFVALDDTNPHTVNDVTLVTSRYDGDQYDRAYVSAVFYGGRV